jgi:hypothetical protein
LFLSMLEIWTFEEFVDFFQDKSLFAPWKLICTPVCFDETQNPLEFSASPC